MREKKTKPLGGKAYGSIPHLPGSRRGPADKGLSEHQARILTQAPRDRHDIIIVQEKLDGSCVSAAKINGEIVPLTRAGYHAKDSNFSQHHFFADWVEENKARFDLLLCEGERAVGEWLMEAHGTLYNLPHEPFVLFDIMEGTERATYQTLRNGAMHCGFVTPNLISIGDPVSIETVLGLLDKGRHGAVDMVEGAVWRCERHCKVDFLGKYVCPEKVDGKYLESVTGKPPIYNWMPRPASSK